MGGMTRQESGRVNVSDSWRNRVEAGLLGGRKYEQLNYDEQRQLACEAESQIRQELYPKIEAVLEKQIGREAVVKMAVARRFTLGMWERMAGVDCDWQGEESGDAKANNQRRKAAAVLGGLAEGGLLAGTQRGTLHTGYHIEKEDGTLGEWDDYRQYVDGKKVGPRVSSLVDMYTMDEGLRERILAGASKKQIQAAHREAEQMWSEEFKKVEHQVEVTAQKREPARGDLPALVVALTERAYHEYMYKTGELKSGDGESGEAVLRQEMAEKICGQIESVSQGRGQMFRTSLLAEVAWKLKNEAEISDRLGFLQPVVGEIALQAAVTPVKMAEMLREAGETRENPEKIGNIYVAGGWETFTGAVVDDKALKALALMLGNDLGEPAVKGAVLLKGAGSVEMRTANGVNIHLTQPDNDWEQGRVAAVEQSEGRVSLYKYRGEIQRWIRFAYLNVTTDVGGRKVVEFVPETGPDSVRPKFNERTMEGRLPNGWAEVLRCPIETSSQAPGQVIVGAGEHVSVTVLPVDYQKLRDNPDKWVPEYRKAQYSSV